MFWIPKEFWQTLEVIPLFFIRLNLVEPIVLVLVVMLQAWEHLATLCFFN